MATRPALFALFLTETPCFGASSPKPEPSAYLILEVINKHNTMGRKIPSVYLRVFSDGTVECHEEKWRGQETNFVKKKRLAPEELKGLKAVLENPELAQVKKRYGLMYWVIDSWMEWDIRLPHHWRTQTIQVLNFSPSSAREKKTPYPDSLVKLGCSILTLRREVYGDNTEYRDVDCIK
jgi:hypothetical protein